MKSCILKVKKLQHGVSRYHAALFMLGRLLHKCLSWLVAPPLEHREECASHFAVFFDAHGMWQQFVHFIYKLCAMFYHPLHVALLQELTVLVAVVAVVIGDAAVGIGAAVAVLREFHAATLAQLWQLPLLEGFLLGGEGRFVGGKFVGLLIGDKIAARGSVCPLDAVEIAGN